MEQQYYELLDKLLFCSTGKEKDVLEANAELVDDRFRNFCDYLAKTADRELCVFLEDLKAIL